MSDGLVLFELNHMRSALISYSYLANVLERKYNASLIAYVATEPRGSYFSKILKTLRYSMGSIAEQYRSFGINEVLVPTLNDTLSKDAALLFNETKATLLSKSDVENITIDGVILGDLFYDSYLREYDKPTVDLESESFLESLLSSIRTYIFWRNYFDNNRVRAINVSHCGYNLAIPLRIAINRGKKLINMAIDF